MNSIGHRGPLSSGHRPFCAISDAAAVTIWQVRSSRLHSLKERITAASYRQYVSNYCCEVRLLTLFHSTDGVRPKSHHSFSLQGARLARRHSCTSRGTIRRYYLQRAELLAVVPVCSVRTRRPAWRGVIRHATNNFLDIRSLALLDEQPFYSDDLIAEALGISHSTILSHLRESFGMRIFACLGSGTSQWPFRDRFGWKFAESYCSFSRLTKNINSNNLWERTRVGSLWTFITLRNGACPEMMCLKRWSNKLRPRNSCW
jgi:hypothetical protein